MKKNVTFAFIAISIFSLFILTGALFCLLGHVLFSRTSAVDAYLESGGQITVVIDAGHGGSDSGASFGNVLEKDLNLIIAKKIASNLSLYNLNVVLTRTEDRLLASDSSKNKKRDDLKNRVNIVTKYDDCVFVSVHMNKFPESKYNGLQVFYSPNHPHSEALALVIQGNNKEYLEPKNQRGAKKANSSIYVLDVIQTPAVLIECGFLSNTDDLKKLTDEEYQNKLAFVIANSIIEFINL